MIFKAEPTLDWEKALWSKGKLFIAGVDEVGKGALARPVVAGAVILPSDIDPAVLAGLRDSKQMSAKQRILYDDKIRAVALSVGFGDVPAEEIDAIEISAATKKAMWQAINPLSPTPQHLLVDTVRLGEKTPSMSIIHGDAYVFSIAAASVIAKNYRDQLMHDLDEIYPRYGFAGHVGYGTAKHLAAIQSHGPLSIHRKAFEPISSMLAEEAHIDYRREILADLES